MKVFIFGAGASADAHKGHVVHDKAIPPLTKDLFDPRYSDFAKMVGISDPNMNRYRNSMSKYASLEEWLTEEWNKLQTLKLPSAKQAQIGFLGEITFYIWLVLSNVSVWSKNNKFKSRETNSYEELLNRINQSQKPFTLINFNYDLILDYAVKDVFKVTFQGLDDYLNNNYIKPHGSINWLLGKRVNDKQIDIDHEYHMDTKVRLDMAINQMYAKNPLSLDGILVKEPDHRDLETIDDLLRSFKKQYFYPLIFLPLTSKNYSSIAGFEDKVISKAKTNIESAEEIFLIGYRANDSIIKDLLKVIKRKTFLHVVGISSADEIMERVLGYNLNLVRGKTFHEGFHDFAYSTDLTKNIS